MKLQRLSNTVLLLVLVSILAGCSQKEELQIFLCIGQSNMAGRAEIPAEDTLTLKNVFLFNDLDTWEPAKNPMNRYSSVRKNLSMQRLGPSWSFARTLSERNSFMKIGMLVNARGGTSINQWKKGEQLYNEAMIRALKAQKTGRIRAVIWHQGESDSKRWTTYAEKFDSLASNIRKDLGIPELPIIVGEVGKWRETAVDINRVLASLGNHIEHVGTASAEGLTHLGDNSHFDARSQKVLGERYAAKYIEIRERE